MKINFQDSAYKDLKKVDKAQVSKILQTINKLKNYPNVSNVKKLKNHYPPYRLRVGNYRILFDIENEEIFISYILYQT